MEATHIVVVVLIVIATVFLILFERSSRKNTRAKAGGEDPSAAGKP